MWLLDVNVPHRLVEFLREFEIAADHAGRRGWAGLTNGELVKAAFEAGFTAVLTRDRLFSESAARTLKRFPAFSVVLVALPQLRGSAFLERFKQEWAQKRIETIPGSIVTWPRSD